VLNRLRITAINGWALPSTWFRDQVLLAFPEAEVTVLAPENPEDSKEPQELLSDASADLYIGYSLGSLWLLKNRDHLPHPCAKALIAPILAFTSEMNLGGKTSATQIQYLIRILSRHPDNDAPLTEFFSNANLPIPDASLHDLPSRDSLIRGLKFLLNTQVKHEAACGFSVIIGENDVLLDAAVLQKHIPHLKIIAETGHNPTPLLKQLATLLP